MPIIAIFTPGTLTVQLSPRSNITIAQRSIPSLNYSAFRQFSEIGVGGPDTFRGPSSEVSRLMAAVTSQGSILNPPAPYTNCSYYLDFYAPSLSCSSATSINTTRVAEMINTASASGRQQFVSFVPIKTFRNNQTDAALSGLQYVLDGETLANLESTYDTVSEDHARIYIVVRDGYSSNFDNETIECGLYNTSYNINFSFQDGQPNLTILNSTRLNGVHVASSAELAQCASGVCSPEAVAYIALLNALGQQLLGYLQLSHYGYLWPSQTQVTKTVLMDTKEMVRARASLNKQDQDTLLADALGMSEALEEIFANATLSLFSRASFLCVLNIWHPVPFYYHAGDKLMNRVEKAR